MVAARLQTLTFMYIYEPNPIGHQNEFTMVDNLTDSYMHLSKSRAYTYLHGQLSSKMLLEDHRNQHLVVA